MQDKRLNREIILVVIITIVLLILAIFIYLNRQNNNDVQKDNIDQNVEEKIPPKDNPEIILDDELTDEEEEKLEEDVKDLVVEDGEIIEEPFERKTPICDKDTTPTPSQKMYENYITISTLDANGCTLINNVDNKEYIRTLSMYAYNEAYKNQVSFTFENASKGQSVRADQMTVKNSKGNIIGWAQLLFFSDGSSSGIYAYSRNNQWVFLKN